MKLEQYSLSGGLAAEQIDLMKQKAIELVERVGLHVPHAGILGLLAQHDGVKVDGETVKFATATTPFCITLAFIPVSRQV